MAVGMIEVTIIAPPPSMKRLPHRKMKDALRQFTAKVKRDFDKTMATWDKHPTFKEKVKFARGEGTAKVSVVDKVYGALDEGTDIRWALLSGDWRSKTRPGFIGSGPGAGRVLMRGGLMKKAGIPPGPGIEARGWSGVIAKKFEPIFEKDMKLTIDETISEALGVELM